MPKVLTLGANTPSVEYLCKKDKRLAKVIRMVGPISYVPHSENNTYLFLIHEVIEQMLTIKAGEKKYKRLEDLCEGNVNPEIVSLLSDEQIESIGTSRLKTRCIHEITNTVINGDLNFRKLDIFSDEEIIHELTKIHGIGK